MDVSTDIGNKALLLVYVRYVDLKIEEVNEELLLILLLHTYIYDSL
jgi:hypothetical protein